MLGVSKLWCSHDASAVGGWATGCVADRVLSAVDVKGWRRRESSELNLVMQRFELKSLILAQIERWRHALHMQVERQRGGNPGGERRTGE